MLGKIMKYDFKNLGKMFIPMYIGIGLLAMFSLMMSVMENAMPSNGLSVISLVNSGALFLLVAGLILVPMVSPFISGYKFFESMVKNQGYLTHTLPVKKSTLIIGKNLTGGIFCLFSTLVSIVVFVIYVVLTWGMNSRFDFSEILEPIRVVMNSPEYMNHKGQILLIIFLFLVGVVLQMFGNVGFISMCASIGQRMNKNKGAWTVGAYLIINFAVSTVTQLVMGFFAVICQGYFNNLEQLIEDHKYSYLMLVFLFAIVFNAVSIVIYNAIAIRFFDKKINME
ncbi:MAG: hypothetical protein K6G62_06450 [Eubacterium sp.]|nr:hypothetical protein [Eubacterium sp.]